MKRFILMLVISGCAAPSFAASQIEKNWATYGGNGFFNWQSTSTLTYGDGTFRRDSEFGRLFRSTPERRILIEHSDLDTRWEIDPDRKRYTEELISEANAHATKELEKKNAEWKEQDKHAQPAPYRVASAKTITEGPSATVLLNGFSSQAYTVKTVVHYEAIKDHSDAGHQTLFFKEWISSDPALTRFHADELTYWRGSGNRLNTPEFKQVYAAMKQQVEKARSGNGVDPWEMHLDAIAKIKGEPVRDINGMTFFVPGQPVEKNPIAPVPNDPLLHASDFSGGVGGLVSGIASRWASRKVGEKIQTKMAEHPAWIDEVSVELDHAPVGWGVMNEIKSVRTDVPSDVFNLPVGYKKVKSL